MPGFLRKTRFLKSHFTDPYRADFELIVVLLRERFQTVDDNLFKAIDEAATKAETQLRKYHDKAVDHR